MITALTDELIKNDLKAEIKGLEMYNVVIKILIVIIIIRFVITIISAILNMIRKKRGEVVKGRIKAPTGLVGFTLMAILLGYPIMERNTLVNYAIKNNSFEVVEDEIVSKNQELVTHRKRTRFSYKSYVNLKDHGEVKVNSNNYIMLPQAGKVYVVVIKTRQGSEYCTGLLYPLSKYIYVDDLDAKEKENILKQLEEKDFRRN